LMVLFVGACAYQHRPVYTVDDPTPRWVADLPLSRVEDLIVSAASPRGWKCQHVAEGHLVATQSQEKFSATVDIYFDRQHWRIAYQSSVGLGAENGEIHAHYNFWVRNLEHDINQRFAAVLGASS